MIVASAIILLTYTVYICRVGFPDSISASFYSLKHRWVFTLVLYAAAMLMMPEMIEKSDEDFQFLAFLTCGGIMFVGVAPNFIESDMDLQVHKCGAIISALASQFWVMAHCPPAYVWWVPGAVMIYLYRSKWLFFMEVTAILTIYTGIYIME